MKTPLILSSLFALGLVSCENPSDQVGGPASQNSPDHSSQEGHSHASTEQKVIRPAGPNGGRVLKNFSPAVEIKVTKDKYLMLTAVDKDLKPISFDSPIEASAVVGSPLAPATLHFTALGDGRYRSDQAIPESKNQPCTVTIGSRSELLNLDLSSCPTCEFLEYACTCGH